MISDFKEFESKLKLRKSKILNDTSIIKYTDIWNNYIKSLISSLNGEIELSPENVEVVVVKEVDLKCNAFVQKIGQTYFIAINYYILEYYQERIQKYFLNYDNFNHLVSSFKLDESLSDMTEISFSTKNSPYYSFFNSPDIRYNIFANFIYNNILYFIIFHEFGHIITGQLEDRESKNIFYELQENSSGNLEDQGREFLADFYGTVNTVRTAVVFNTLSIKQYTTVIGLLKFSAWCMLSFFTIDHTESDLEVDFKTYLDRNKKYNHPPVAVRLYYIYLMIEHEIGFHLNETFRPNWFQSEDSDRKRGLVKVVQIHSDRILSSLIKNSTGDVALRFGKDVLGSLTLEYYFRVRENASLISKKLQPISFVKTDIEGIMSKRDQEDLEDLKEFEKREKVLEQDDETFISYLREIDEKLYQELITLL